MRSFFGYQRVLAFEAIAPNFGFDPALVFRQKECDSFST